MEFYIVEKKNKLATHGVFSSKRAAEKHLKEVIPAYCQKGYFMDKTLTPECFKIKGDKNED